MHTLPALILIAIILTSCAAQPPRLPEPVFVSLLDHPYPQPPTFYLVVWSDGLFVRAFEVNPASSPPFHPSEPAVGRIPTGHLRAFLAFVNEQSRERELPCDLALRAPDSQFYIYYWACHGDECLLAWDGLPTQQYEIAEFWLDIAACTDDLFIATEPLDLEAFDRLQGGDLAMASIVIQTSDRAVRDVRWSDAPQSLEGSNSTSRPSVDRAQGW